MSERDVVVVGVGVVVGVVVGVEGSEGLSEREVIGQG